MYQHTEGTATQAAGQELSQAGTSQIRKILILLVSLIIIVGGSFISYAGVIHPLQIHAQATSVINGIHIAQVQSSPQYLYNQITSKTPTLNDPLDSQHETWQVDTSCSFAGGAYHVLAVPTTDITPICLNGEQKYGNFIYQVQMTFIHGSVGGIEFRAADAQHLYSFAVSDNGLYFAEVVSGSNGKILAYGRSASIKPGPNQPNLLAVMARGNIISFYVNKQFITSINDDTYESGMIGCSIAIPTQDNFDAAFSHAQVWNL